MTNQSLFSKSIANPFHCENWRSKKKNTKKKYTPEQRSEIRNKMTFLNLKYAQESLDYILNFL